MDQEKAIAHLIRVAERRERADNERRFATIELHKYVHMARAAGVGVTEIAGAAALSRQAVYEILGQQPS
jgi:hypothetical protein